MIYVETVIEVAEKDMENMVGTIIDDVVATLDDYGFPTTKEMKITVLKEVLKVVFEKERLDN